MKEVELHVNFQVTKSVDDYESVKVQGGISIPIAIEDEADYAKQYRHWLKVIQNEVVGQAYKYYKAVQKAKIINFPEKSKRERDDLDDGA